MSGPGRTRRLLGSSSRTTPGALAPLRNRIFAVLWFATVLGNLGTFMRDVASAWLVIELSNSATAVALVQAATTLPVFLLAIPAGVLSDILDRRRLLVAVQAGLAVVSSVLALFAWFGGHSVASLVGLTLLGGIGAAYPCRRGRHRARAR
jgi:MFS family permease